MGFMGGDVLKATIVFLAILFGALSLVRAQNTSRFPIVYENKIDDKNFFLGHSLTQTSYTLRKNKAMAGTFAFAYGLTDQITVATSPYLLSLYNMPNIIIRTGAMMSERTKIGVHFGYMKTQKYLENDYDMENAYSNFILTRKWSRLSASHFQLNTMYFMEESRPFSIRVPRPTSPLQVSLSVLNEFSFYKRYQNEFGLGLEFGVLGLNEVLPYNHLGFSFYRKFKSVIFQAGLSVSATQNITFSNLMEIGKSNIRSNGGEYKKIVTHPEIQLQYFF